MNKGLYVVVICILIGFLTGCGENIVKTKCTLVSDNKAQGFKLEATYTIYGKGDVADKVEIEEKVTSDTSTTISYFESSWNTAYESLNNAYGGYTYKTVKKGNSVISSVVIDYSKVDMKQLLQDQTVMKGYVDKNNRFTISGLKKLYKETKDMNCEK